MLPNMVGFGSWTEYSCGLAPKLFTKLLCNITLSQVKLPWSENGLLIGFETWICNPLYGAVPIEE